MSSTESLSSRNAQLSPLQRAVLAIEELQTRLKASEQARNEPIAVIGMGCRFPGANGIAEFWNLLRAGRDAVREVPRSRWNIDEFYDPNPDVPGKMSSRWGGFLDAVDQFDPEFFGISPREAIYMDPQQRLLLEVAWEALEHAGQSPSDLAASPTGVFVGLTSDEYAQSSFRDGVLSRFNAYFASGVARSIAGGRISYVLGIQGPNMAIDTACSSSLVAVHSACMSLRARECRTALAGGATVVLSPEIGIAFSKAHMMAADGRCKAFDSRADGFVRGEGCGMVVLKRQSDALADGDRILALIRGSAINQDGRSSGMTAPSRAAQEAVLRTALAQAGVQPEEIGYVEAHGTGTSLGDPIEAHALAEVLCAARDHQNPLIVGSVKTNLGHLEAAAGIAGLIKVVLMLGHEVIPRNLHFEKLNPHIDWDGRPIEIPVEARPWLRSERRRVAGVSSFGFSGTNAHLTVEEAPQPRPRQQRCDAPIHVLALSARSEAALRTLGESYAGVLDGTPLPPGDLCFTANAGRAHFEHRLAVTGSSAEALREALLQALPGKRILDREGVSPVFLFPGQGAQFAGMGKQMFDTHPVFRSTLEQCARILEDELERPLLDVLWGVSTHLLDETVYSQPALFSIEYALAVLWRSWGIEPAAVLGHSVGEYVAACVAGVYSLEDGLKLIARRGRLMQGVAGQGAMAAVHGSEGRVAEALRGLEPSVCIAAINAPESVVISGYERELHLAEKRLRDSGMAIQRLNVSRAFHSPQMHGMQEPFEKAVREVTFRSPGLRLISSVTGQAVSRSEMSEPAYWVRQVSEPVQFQKAMETLRASGAAVFLECGPGATLSGLGQQCSPEQGTWLTSLRRQRGEWSQMLHAVSELYVRGANIDWAAFHRPFDPRRVTLPTYPFERQRYWIAPLAESAEGEMVLSGQAAQPKTAGLATRAIAEADPADEWFYRVVWTQRHLPRAEEAVCRTWIVLADRTGVAQGLCARMRAAGYACVLLDAGGPGTVRTYIEPHASAVGILDLRSLDHKDHAAEPSCLSFLDLLKEVQQGYRPGITLWKVTRGAMDTGQETDPVLPWLAPVWALGRTAASEHPEFWGGMVDLDPAATLADTVDHLWDQLTACDGEDQIAFRKGRRLTARLERYSPPSPGELEFHAEAAYLITGGHGGLGLEVARWMVSKGAKHILLMGRTGLLPRSEWETYSSEDPRGRAVAAILAMEQSGASVQSVTVDVGEAGAVQNFFRSYEAQSRPPIRGVVHAAGAMRHALLVKTTEDDLRLAFRAKVDGTWFLHEALKGMEVDFFVAFSSASAVLSSPRLGSYAASNAFLDALAAYRSHQGLSALSVNWGIWANVGMARPAEGAAPKHLEEHGMAGMQIEQGLACLGRLIAGATGQVGVLPIDWKLWNELYPAYMAKPFFSELFSGKRLQPASTVPKTSGPELLEVLKNTPESVRIDRIGEFLRIAAARLLGFPTGHPIDPHQPLNELGLDSLMALELRNAVSAGIGQSLPATLLFNHPTLADITIYLRDLLFAAPSRGAQRETISDAERSVLDNIEELSDEEVDRMLARRVGPSQ